MSTAAETTEDLLSGTIEQAAVLLADVAPSSQERIDRVFDAALSGSRLAAREFVRNYLEITVELLQLAGRSDPELVVAVDGSIVAVELAGERAPCVLFTLRRAAYDLQLSPLVSRYGPGRAAALLILSAIRSLLGSYPPLSMGGDVLRETRADLDDRRLRRFERHLAEAFDGASTDLERIMEALALNKTETARLFGVKRQAVDQWLDRGVPAARLEKVASVAAVADILHRNLEPDRIGGIARRLADAYGGISMLEMIEADRHEELRGVLTATFDWASTA